MSLHVARQGGDIPSSMQVIIERNPSVVRALKGRLSLMHINAALTANLTRRANGLRVITVPSPDTVLAVREDAPLCRAGGRGIEW